MESITININETKESLNLEMTENSESVSVEMSEGAKGFVYYTITFGADASDVYGFQSKHFGVIANVELTNIDTYTINGGSLSEIELNKTYQVEIVRAAAGEAVIRLTIAPAEYSEAINSINFDVGGGRYVYVLSRNANAVYKLDSDLLTPANTSGVGTWTVDPLVATINLPVLPVGAGFDKMCFTKDGKMFVMGGYSSANDNYYAIYILDDDSITDLDGNIGQYSTFAIGFDRTYVRWLMYDFVNNNVYFSGYQYEFGGGCIDLETNSLINVSSPFMFRANTVKNKIFFNPYRMALIDAAEKIITEPGQIIQGNEIRFTANENKAAYCRKTNQIVAMSSYYLKFGDPYTGIQTASLSQSPNLVLNAYNYSIDYDNEVYLTSINNNRFSIHRINEGDRGSYTLTNPDPVSNILNCGMFAKNNIHVLCTFGAGYSPFGGVSKRMQVIDASSPVAAQPDFNYYDVPETIDDIYTNRLL